jgi:hypothetical protein
MLRHVGLCAVAATLDPAVGVIGAPLATAPDREGHPITGSWLAVTPLGPAELIFDAQGDVLVMWPHSGEGSNGYYEYTTIAKGLWHPVSPDALILTVVGCEVDGKGGVSGLVGITSRTVVSIDGGSFHGSRAADRLTRTLLDGTTTVLLGTDAALEPLSGIRM